MKQLQFWILPNNGFETITLIREHLAAYERERPGARVVAEVRTQSSMWEQLFRIVKNPHRDPKPDIVQIPSHWTSTLAQLGLLQDLRELDPGLDLGVWTALAQKNCRLAGTERVYSLPWWLELRVLYYRKDAFRRIKRDPVEMLATWEGLRRSCRELARDWKAGSGRFPIGNSNTRESVSMTDLAPCLWSRGADYFSPDGTRCLFQRAHASAGIGGYLELLQAGWMPLIGQNGLPPGNLFNGGCALQFSGRFHRPNGSSGGLPLEVFSQLGALEFPGSGEKPSATIANVHSLAILRDVENPRKAYALLRELARDSAAAAYARAIGAFPATEGGVSSSLADHPEFRAVFERSLASARTLPNLRTLGTLEKIFDRSMERLVREIIYKSYRQKALFQELVHSAAEMDYVLSMSDSAKP